MNNLQHISENDFGPVLVTLNPLVPPRQHLTRGTWEYTHPQVTTKVYPILLNLRAVHRSTVTIAVNKF